MNEYLVAGLASDYAEESGHEDYYTEYKFDDISIVNFARAIASMERKACVDIIQSFGEKESATLDDLVSAIRKRGKDD